MCFGFCFCFLNPMQYLLIYWRKSMNTCKILFPFTYFTGFWLFGKLDHPIPFHPSPKNLLSASLFSTHTSLHSTMLPSCTPLLLVVVALESVVGRDLHWSLDGRSAQHFGTRNKDIQTWPSLAYTSQKHIHQRIHHISPHTSRGPWTLGYLKLKERFRL